VDKLICPRGRQWTKIDFIIEAKIACVRLFTDCTMRKLVRSIERDDSIAAKLEEKAIVSGSHQSSPGTSAVAASDTTSDRIITRRARVRDDVYEASKYY
jgi:hypothetical protein